MHYVDRIREPLSVALTEAPAHKLEWWRAWPDKQKADRWLGELWHCTDPVPAEVREGAATWLDALGHHGGAAELREREALTWAVMVRLLRIALHRRWRELAH